MTVLPVVAREMAVMARRKSMYWSRWITAILALLVMLWLLLVSASAISFSELGSSIFVILGTICFVFTALVGMQATADCLSEEKREGTLGLLFLTDLKGFDVIAGKLVASSLHAVLVLIGIIPMLSLAFLLGGVTLQQFGMAALVLCNTLFFSLTLGVLVSSLSENERRAMVGTFVCIFVLFVGPFLLAFVLGRGVTGELLAASPIFPFVTIHTGPGNTTFPTRYFWPSLIGTHLAACFFLFLAALILPRCIHVVPSRRFARLREFTDNFVYGRKEQRKKHRARLLDRNAFLWLGSRERVKPKYAWLILGSLVAIYAWIFLQFGNLGFFLPVAVIMVTLAQLVFKIWIASEVCSRLIQDRRGGALELLLCTPLSVRHIAEGQSLALRRVFLWPIIVLLLLEIWLLIAGLKAPGQVESAALRKSIFIALMGTFLADLWALKWVGLWLSLTGKSIERVLLATIMRVLILPWIVYAVFGGFTGARMLFGHHVDFINPILGWGLIATLISLFLGLAARYQFLTQFRELATRRFDALPEAENAPAAEPQIGTIRPRLRVIDLFLRRPVANSIFLFLLLTVVILWGRAQYWNHRVKSEIAAARANGYPTSLQEANRYHVAPPRAENAFAGFEDAGVVASPSGVMVFGALSDTGQNLPPEKRKAEIRNKAAALLNVNAPRLAAVRKLSSYKRAYVDPFGDLWGFHMMHMGYMGLVEAEIILSATESSELARARAEQAIRTSLVHTRLLRQQPLVFGQTAASASLHRLGVAIEEILERNLLTSEQLAEFQREIGRVDDPTVVVRTLALQRAFFLEPQIALQNAIRMTVPGGSPIIVTLQRFIESTGSGDKRLALLLEQYVDAFKLAAQPYPQRARAIDLFRMVDFAPMVFAVGGMPSPFGQLPDVFNADAAFTAYLNLLRALFALEQYERNHGKAAASLAALVPEFLPAVPMDPYTGQALKAVERDGAIYIYSVWLDRIDNTASGSSKRTAGDLVFKFPLRSTSQ